MAGIPSPTSTVCTILLSNPVWNSAEPQWTHQGGAQSQRPGQRQLRLGPRHSAPPPRAPPCQASHRRPVRRLPDQGHGAVPAARVHHEHLRPCRVVQASDHGLEVGWGALATRTLHVARRWQAAVFKQMLTCGKLLGASSLSG